MLLVFMVDVNWQGMGHLYFDVCCPVKNLSSQLTHWELTLKLTESSFWVCWVTSQWTRTMIRTVNLLLLLREFATHTVSLMWAIHEITHVVVLAQVPYCNKLKHQKSARKYRISFPLPELTRVDLISGVQNLGCQFGIGLPESSISNWTTTATNSKN